MNPKSIITTAAVTVASFLECVPESTMPHRFDSITMLPDHSISLSLTGRVTSTFRPYFDLYVVETSTNLADWKPLVTLVRTNASTNALTYVDSTKREILAGYYRTFTNQFVTPLAPPTGPYAVGRIKRLVTDSTRTNRYNIETNSSFMVTFWYPAVPNAGVLPGEYLEKKLVESIGEAVWDEPGNVAQMFSFSLPDAAIAPSPSAFPIVIYATGYMSPRDTNAEKAEELASHGYVVAAMDFSESLGTVFPDGRVLSGSFAEGFSGRVRLGRVQDVAVVVNELGRMNRDDPRFAGRLDMQSVGGMGFSAGIQTIAEAGLTNASIRAEVLLDGYVSGEPDRVGVQKPVLEMYAEGASDDRTFSKATADVFVCHVKGAEHITFKDLVDSRMATRTSREAAAAIRACMLSFFDKYLKAQDDHLLDNPTNRFPVLLNFKRK